MKKKQLESKYISAIYAGLNSKQLNDEKENLVYQFTHDRTTSVRAMSKHEALGLIAFLNEGRQSTDKKTGKMIRTIYSFAYSLNITQLKGDKVSVDTKRLNKLVLSLSPQKKGLQQHSYKELIILVTVFEKYYKQQVNKSNK